MNQPQQPNDSKQIRYEREFEELVSECHSLIVAIAQRPYAVKLLKSVRQGLLMHLDYKENRKKLSNRDNKGSEL